jgi:hypothetical protein
MFAIRIKESVFIFLIKKLNEQLVEIMDFTHFVVLFRPKNKQYH